MCTSETDHGRVPTASLWSDIWEPMASLTYGQPLPTSSCHAACKQFLQDARKRCLTIRSWSQDEELLEHKEHFFSSLPLIAMEKFRDYIDQTFKSKHQAVCGLLELQLNHTDSHTMQIRDTWKHHKVQPGLLCEDLRQDWKNQKNQKNLLRITASRST